jgi:hypothetical protein
MCSIRVICGRVFDTYQVIVGGKVIAEYWIKIDSELTIKEVAREHNRAGVMADGYGKVSEA